MAQVIMPQSQKNKDLPELLQIGGMVGGAALGGPAGAGMGASLGGALGGMASQQPQAQQVPQQQQSSAMMRRQQQMETDNLAALKQAEAATVHLPEPMRQQYLPALTRARMIEESQRGMV